MNPDVAVVILNYNGKKWLEKFIPSIKKTQYTPYHIYIADNASTDGSIEWIQQYESEITLLSSIKNLGYTGGYNWAINQIHEPYAILLNSDVEVHPDWIGPLVSLAETDPLISAIQPKILGYNNREFFEYAGASGGFIDKYGYPFCRGRIFHTLEKDIGQYNNEIEVFWASGACLFIRTSDFINFGGFCEHFFAHMEEIDLCWRLKLAGKKIMVQPNSMVWHVGGGTLSMGSPNKTFLNYRNGLMTLERNLPPSKKSKIIFWRMIFDGISAIRFIHPRQWIHIKSILKAHAEFKKWRKTNTHHAPEYSLYKVSGLIPTSIVIQYFLKGIKFFHQLIKKT